MGSAQDKDLLSLIRKARRFFPQGSASEIWEELGPLLSKTHTMDCMIVRNLASLAYCKSTESLLQTLYVPSSTPW